MSNTYYLGDKGDEIADYSFNYKLGTTIIKSTSKFYYGTGDGVEASLATTTDSMVRSSSFKDEGTLAAKLMSNTYYLGDKGDEIADYSFNYKLGTTIIKSTSKFYYGTGDGVEASLATTTDSMVRSSSFKDEGTLAAKLMSNTYYLGDKGDEIADYSFNYKLGTTIIKSTSKFYYGTGDGVEASLATTTDSMVRSSSFKDEGTLAAKLMANTYYLGDKGDEIADYSFNYKLGTTIIKSTSKFYYGTGEGVEASLATTTDSMVRSSSFKDEGTLAAKLMANTYYLGDKGDEIADYSFNYKLGTTIIKSTSKFYYGTGEGVEASLATTTDSMVRSSSFKDEGTLAAKLMSNTYYLGDKGDEIADYSYNYKLGTTIIKSTSKFYYGTGDGGEASLATTTDSMVRSSSFKDEGTLAAKLMSNTYYLGDKGDEIADYSFNYKLGTTIIKSTSKFYYGTGDGVEASLATTTDSMVRSSSFKDEGTLAEKLMSNTYYLGDKGDEIADYSFNYKLGTTIIKSTSKFYYGTGDGVEASLATTTDSMVRSSSFKDEGTLAAKLMSNTYYL